MTTEQNNTVEGTETEEWELDFNGNYMNNGLHGVLEERYQDVKMILLRDFIRKTVQSTRADERKKILARMPKWSDMDGNPDYLDGFSSAMSLVFTAIRETK